MTEAAVGVGFDREVGLVEAFVELAHALVDEVDVQEVMIGLAEHCVHLLGAVACGVLLTDARGALQVLAASPESAAVLELLQVQVEEGPCVDCLHSGEAVRSGDLAGDVHRWPIWVPIALEHGVSTVYATPMRARDTVIGTLNLFGSGQRGLSAQDLLVGRALADVATVTIMQQRRIDEAWQLNAQLQTALESRTRIEQAKGIIAHALAVDVDHAFQLLRHNSRSTNVKLATLCGHLIDGRITAADLVPLRPRAAAPTLTSTITDRSRWSGVR